MQRSSVLALLVLASAACVSASRPAPAAEDLAGLSPARSLLQNARCPAGCQVGFCFEDSTTGGLRCTQCLGNLLVNPADGTCMCPKGTYVKNITVTQNTCEDCPRGSYCIGGKYDGLGAPSAVGCPDYMTTPGKRFFKPTDCVNKPGYSYSVNATGYPSATLCPDNTYSTGFKRQRACVPCPTGFITDPAGTGDPTYHNSPTDCFVPAGSYLKSPGQAALCPKGEYKDSLGPSGNCTKCAFGVTTAAEGSISESNCTLLVAGRYALTISSQIIKATMICPQKYTCPGGPPSAPFDINTPSTADNVTITKCPNGLWTIELGSTNDAQCLTPPGYMTSGTGDNATVQCADGWYRADWKPANLATQCSQCGTNVFADKTDQLKIYNNSVTDPTAFWLQAITTSADDCYIEAGTGLYYSTITGSWRARNCDTNNYGVTNRTYGLTPSPCKDCPTGMVAINNASYPNSSVWFTNGTSPYTAAYGFYSALACVTLPGYGYNGRIAQKCDVGYWNPQDTRSACTACAYGLTTSGVGAADRESLCGIAAGYGYHNDSGTYGIVPCPISYYNAVPWNTTRTVPCVSCGTGLTTTKEGASSLDQCNQCQAGYGPATTGGTDCATTCKSGSFGVAGRENGTACSNCSFSGTGFSFHYNLANDVYAPSAVSREASTSTTDCLTSLTQIVDGAWYIPVNNYSYVTLGANATGYSNFSSCAQLCTDTPNCMFLNYWYDFGLCQVITNGSKVTLDSDAWIAWKAGPSGDTAMNAASKKARTKEGKASSISSGSYSWFQDSSVPTDTTRARNSTFPYGTLSTPSNANSFTVLQDCLNACDDDGECAGVTFYSTGVASTTAKDCKLIKGDTTNGVFIRTMVKTQIARLTLPDTLKALT